MIRSSTNITQNCKTYGNSISLHSTFDVSLGHYECFNNCKFLHCHVEEVTAHRPVLLSTGGLTNGGGREVQA